MKYLLFLFLLIPTHAKAFTADDVFNAVNRDRRAPLVRNTRLETAAQAKADALSACSCFSHDIGKTTPWYFIKKTGYRYRAAAENLAQGFMKVEDLNTAWMNSPSHRKNILAGYKETGIGISEGTFEGKKTVFVVQMFGYPR
jgi:uncharacterized protein YkwD